MPTLPGYLRVVPRPPVDQGLLRRATEGVRTEIVRIARAPVEVVGEVAVRGRTVGRRITGSLIGPYPPAPPPPPAPEPQPEPGPQPPPPPPPRPVVVIHRLARFRITEDIAGGSSTSELRIYGPVPVPFDVVQIVISPLAGVQVGQTLDFIVGQSLETTDTSTPDGTLLTIAYARRLTAGVPDNLTGLSVPTYPVSILNPWSGLPAGTYLKVIEKFASPATALADVEVIMSIKEYH